MTNSAVNGDSMHDLLDRKPCGLAEHDAAMLRKRLSCEARDQLPA